MTKSQHCLLFSLIMSWFLFPVSFLNYKFSSVFFPGSTSSCLLPNGFYLYLSYQCVYFLVLCYECIPELPVPRLWLPSLPTLQVHNIWVSLYNILHARLPPEERQLDTALNPMCEVFPKGQFNNPNSFYTTIRWTTFWLFHTKHPQAQWRNFCIQIQVSFNKH